MSPITHFLNSWALADATLLSHRDRSLITWSGILPDLDGVGVLMDLLNRVLGNPEVFWYARFHHFLLHGLPGVLLLAFATGFLAVRRVQVFLWSFAIVHLHLLCDLIGSRGPYPSDIWPIYYLSPFSKELTLHWQGQWRLNAWPNVVLTVLLIAYGLYRIVSCGRSPVSMFSIKLDVAVTETLRNRWSRLKHRWF